MELAWVCDESNRTFQRVPQVQYSSVGQQCATGWDGLPWHKMALICTLQWVYDCSSLFVMS